MGQRQCLGYLLWLPGFPSLMPIISSDLISCQEGIWYVAEEDVSFLFHQTDSYLEIVPELGHNFSFF